jgi:hypothetical protein
MRNNIKILIGVISNLFFILFILLFLSYYFNWNFFSFDANEESYDPYLNKILYDDFNLKSEVMNIVQNCSYGNKECQVNQIYRNLVENYKYYSDTRYKEFIQTPYETKSLKGGDCEDLTILLNSLLENIGIKTYVVFTEDHAYSLACGLDNTQLRTEILSSFKKEEKYFNGIISIPSNSGRYIGGEGLLLEFPTIMNYSLNSNKPLNLEFVNSGNDLTLWSKGESYDYYKYCSSYGVYSGSGSCKMVTWGGLMLINDNPSEAKVSLNITLEYSAINVSKISITYYILDGVNCTILDSTLGEYGYPGYNTNLTGNKTAVDSISKKEFRLL